MRTSPRGLTVFGAVFVVSMLAQPVAGATRSITVTPSTGLVDSQIVTVTGAGFTPSALVGYCESVVTGGPAGIDQCNNGGAATTNAAGDGSFSGGLAVRRFMFIPRLDAVVDCLDPSVSCIVGAAEASDIAGTVVLAPISFAPQPPSTAAITVTPNVNLKNGTGVKIVGSGFGPDAPVITRQCVASIPGPSGCDLGHLSTTDSTGAFTDDGFPVNNPLQATDCGAAPGTCEIRAFQSDPPASAPLSFLEFQPDNWVVRLINGSGIGDDVYNLDGSGQQQTRSVAPGGRPFFGLLIQNDGAHTDDITVTGPGSSPLFTVRYFVGPYNVTSYVTGAGLTLTGLTSQSFVRMAVDIKADASAPPGATKNVLVTSTSVGDPTKRDAVQVGVVVGGAT